MNMKCGCLLNKGESVIVHREPHDEAEAVRHGPAWSAGGGG